MASKLIGQNYVTPDLVAKVTGKAKYAEDYKADGMLYARLLLSPLPHARIRNIDVSAAQAMPGVKAILLPNEIPAPADIVTDLGQTIKGQHARREGAHRRARLSGRTRARRRGGRTS
jgi:CO/xanthine dehydrogenase Mo-binding subunit